MMVAKKLFCESSGVSSFVHLSHLSVCLPIHPPAAWTGGFYVPGTELTGENKTHCSCKQTYMKTFSSLNTTSPNFPTQGGGKELMN